MQTADDLMQIIDRLDAEQIRAELQRLAERDAALRVFLRAALARAKEREQGRLAASVAG